jgi:hypothetical protein
VASAVLLRCIEVSVLYTEYLGDTNAGTAESTIEPSLYISGTFLQSLQRHLSVHGADPEKHSQYFFKHALFLQ